jgi:hypothetical protein
MSNGPTKTQAAMQKKRSKQMVIQQTARIKASEKKTTNLDCQLSCTKLEAALNTKYLRWHKPKFFEPTKVQEANNTWV